MAILALKDAYISINSTVWSASANHLEVNAQIDDLDKTVFGATWKGHMGGLLDGSGSITFLQDFITAGLDSAFWTLFIAGANVPFEFRPTSAAVGISNPKWTGSMLLKNWNPIGNSVGELAVVKMDFAVDGAITRQTS